MEKILRTIGEVRKFILDIFYPKACVGCKREGKYLCDRCNLFVSEASLICPVCYKPSFGGETHLECKRKYSLDGLLSVWEYEGLIKKMIYEAKLNGVYDIIRESIADFFRLSLTDKRFHPFLSFLFSEDTQVTYVPMCRKKEKKQGFNQAEIIAKELAKTSNSKVVSFLDKRFDTKKQTELGKKERLENIKNSFGIKNYNNEALNLVLVDDVFTSGATIKECSKTLKKSGIKKVWGFTIARTP